MHRHIEFVRPSHIAHTQPGSDQAHLVVRDDSCAIAAHEGEALAIMDGLLGPVMVRLAGLRGGAGG